MTNVVDWLRSKDMGLDGLADEAAAFILENPDLLEDLLTGIDDRVPAVRARTADALEKVGRQRPDLLLPYLPKLVDVAYRDEKAAVKMHLAMMFGHLAVEEGLRDDLCRHLLHLLEEPGVFTRAWAIAPSASWPDCSLPICQVPWSASASWAPTRASPSVPGSGWPSPC